MGHNVRWGYWVVVVLCVGVGVAGELCCWMCEINATMSGLRLLIMNVEGLNSGKNQLVRFIIQSTRK